MLDAAKLRRRVVLRSWLATMYIVDGQGSATARGTRRHVGGVHIVFVGGVHCAYCGCALCSALCIIAAVKNNYPKESAEGAKHKLQRPKPKRFGLQETTFGSSRQNNQGQ